MGDDWEDDDWHASAPALPASAPGAVRGGGAVAAVVEAAAPDDWEDEDAGVQEEPAAAAAAPRAPAPMKQAKRLAQALKEKEALELEAARARAIAREKKLAEMDDAAKKLEMQRIVEEADLDNARDLFGADDTTTGAPAGMPVGENLVTMHPKTEEELAKYAAMFTEKCCKFNADLRRTARYVFFVKEVMRGLTADLGPDDAKDLAAHMNIISNLKLEEYKKAKGGAKKKVSKKTAVRVDRNDTDMLDSSYRDGYDNDDFM
jgi:translation initiation factor 3 subunit J